MSKTIGPILATGLVTIANKSIFHDEPMDWRIPAATGLAAIGFSLGERVWPDVMSILAWTSLITVLLTRIDPKVPSPIESALSWWNEGK